MFLTLTVSTPFQLHIAVISLNKWCAEVPMSNGHQGLDQYLVGMVNPICTKMYVTIVPRSVQD